MHHLILQLNVFKEREEKGKTTLVLNFEVVLTLKQKLLTQIGEMQVGLFVLSNLCLELRSSLD